MSNTCDTGRGRDFHEWIDGHPEPASSHQILCAYSTGTLIPRPRLTNLLDESLRYPLTLISAPAGFGKTSLLSAWTQSLPATNPLVAWVSLGEEDNDPRLFWTYVLSALDQQQPERFTPLFKYLQSQEVPPLMYVLTALINLVLDSAEHLLLILDDYHVITEQQVHTTLSYLVERLPPQLHIILATRIDPPLPLSLLRTRGQVLEVRTDHLRCTAKEIRAFFRQIMSIQLPDDIIQEVTPIPLYCCRRSVGISAISSTI